MYATFFGLKRDPFSIAPDPHFLFMSERHREALAHLLYGLDEGGGFVLLTGEIGAGKTTVCRCFLEQIPKRCNVAYIYNPKLTVTELMKTVCDEFQIPYAERPPGQDTVKDYIDPLNEFLLRMHAVGRNNVLIIDEAQSLSSDVLEQLRLLTNLETNERKLLQIILIGQPELRAMLAMPQLEQLTQRVIARFHLDALSETETAQYIRHRLSVAGLRGAIPFERDALRAIQRWSRGIPRRINLLCDRALLGAYARTLTRIDRAIIDTAAAEVFDTPPPPVAMPWRQSPLLTLGAGVVAGAVLVGLAALAMNGAWRRQPTAVASGTAASAAAPARAGPGAASAVPAPVRLALATPGASAAPPPVATETLALAEAGEAQAWGEMGRLWAVAIDGGEPCAVAQRAQVHCFRSGAGLGLIRQLDRPGVLTLRDDNGQARHAVLVGLDDTRATLRIGGALQTVSLATLATVWRGEFITFWRAPAGYRELVAQGQTGPVVDALVTQLATLRGDPAPAADQLFDGALRTQLNAFQLAHGLRPDGMAGPTTFMQLNRATGVPEPRLQKPG